MRSLPPLATRDRAIGAVLVVGCGIVQAAALAVSAFATRDAFSALHGREPLATRTLLELAVAGGLAALCLFLSRRQAEALGQSYATSLRRVLYEQIAALPKARHEERRTGALSLRFVGDLSAARLWFGRGLPDLLTALVVLPGAVAILVSLDATLALAAMVPLGASLVVMASLAWHLERRHRRLRRRRAGIAIAMLERIAIAPELDLMGRTGKELRALDAQGAALGADAVARRGRSAGLQAILQAGVALAALAMLWLAGRGVATPATVAASLSVLALLAMPLQDMAAAWDRLCAWRVARERARRLLAEPSLSRAPSGGHRPRPVTLSGAADFAAGAGEVARLDGPNAAWLARVIGGLDHAPDLQVGFGDGTGRARVAFIGDAHVGLQGSLRRSATLGARKRPADARITEVLRHFGFPDDLASPRGLDRRIAENGKGLGAARTLRLDLARAVLGKAEVIVISSLRWEAERDRATLLARLRDLTSATIILAAVSSHPRTVTTRKAT